jgi:hypothetical protein
MAFATQRHLDVTSGKLELRCGRIQEDGNGFRRDGATQQKEQHRGCPTVETTSSPRRADELGSCIVHAVYLWTKTVDQLTTSWDMIVSAVASEWKISEIRR